jgi:hypothetical protein
MNLTRISLCISLVALVCSTGCIPVAVHPMQVFSRHSNPIEGWKSVNFKEKPSPAIEKDYHDFLNYERPPGFVGAIIGYLEDGNGNHAISIEIGNNGTYRTCVLIYDRNDKRIRKVKYISGHYGC